MSIAVFDPDVPDYVVRSSRPDFLSANAEGLSADEQEKVRGMIPGDAFSVASGGGCFFVIVAEGPFYQVRCDEGQFYGLAHGRPEPISWEPLS